MYEPLITFSKRRCVHCLLFFSVLFFACEKSYAQEFDKNGNYFPKTGHNRLYDPDKLPDTIRGAKPKINSPSFTQVKAEEDTQLMSSIKKRLLDKVNEAIFNLENDSLHLKDMYTAIWPNFYDGYLKDLIALKTYLISGKGNPSSDDLPTKHLMEAWKDSSIYSEVKDQQWTTNNILAFDLIRKDPYAYWLLAKYKTDLDSDKWLRHQVMDMSYIKRWRALEANFKIAHDAIVWANAVHEDIFKYDADTYNKFVKSVSQIDMSKDSLIIDITKGNFIKNWLWYEGGFPGMNPLLVTTDERVYPDDEVNTYLTANQRKNQNKLDSSKAVMLKNFSQTAKYANLLFLPRRNEAVKDSIYLLELSAADGYHAKDSLTSQKLERKKLMIAAYNIPGEDKATISLVNGKLIYESKFSQNLSNLADQFSVLTAAISPELATFNALETQLNLPVIAPVQENIADHKTYLDELVVVKGSNKESAKPRSTDPNLKWDIINGNYISLSGNSDVDKKRILLAETLNPADESVNKYNTRRIKLIDEFIIEDQSVMLDYYDLQSYNASKKVLDHRFFDFRQKIQGRYKLINLLIDSATKKYEQLKPYVRITNRSLPPIDLKASVDTVPLVRTLISPAATATPPATLTYTVSEQNKGVGPFNQKAQQTVDVIQTQRFDFSLGVAYTSSPYYLSTPGTPLPSTVLGDQFQFIAGAHWYFIKRLNKLHDGAFQHNLERFSLYGGVSIAHALSNYYTGLSYDIVPGVRLIGGWHFYKNYHFSILNNTVADQAAGTANAGLFISIDLEPVIVGKAINLFK